MSPGSCFGHAVALGLAETARLEAAVEQDSQHPLQALFAGLAQDTGCPWPWAHPGLARSLQARPLVCGALNCQMPPKT